jgi:hypothetical protein
VILHSSENIWTVENSQLSSMCNSCHKYAFQSSKSWWTPILMPHFLLQNGFWDSVSNFARFSISMGPKFWSILLKVDELLSMIHPVVGLCTDFKIWENACIEQNWGARDLSMVNISENRLRSAFYGTVTSSWVSNAMITEKFSCIQWCFH